jgi:hypothetical protein
MWSGRPSQVGAIMEFDSRLRESILFPSCPSFLSNKREYTFPLSKCNTLFFKEIKTIGIISIKQ